MYEVLIHGFFGNLILNLLNDDGNIWSMILFAVFVLAPSAIILITLCSTKNSAIIISVIVLLIILVGTNFTLAHLIMDIIFYLFFIKKEGN